MKKISIITTTIVAIVIFSSCSFGRYVPNAVNINGNQTQVILTKANFRIVKHVSTQVFFTQRTFSFNSEQLQQSAYNALRKEADLKGSQILINITLEEVDQIKYTFLGIPKYAKQAIIVSGTVIEFIDENTNIENTYSNTTKNENSIKTKDSLIVTTEQPLKEIEVGSEESINLSDKTFLKACISLGLDKNGDGEISEKEAYLVKNLNIRFWGIKDLTGIEHFKYLKELDASKNLFSEADLSKNIYLKKVKISSKRITKVILPKNSNTISIDIEKNKIIEK